MIIRARIASVLVNSPTLDQELEPAVTVPQPDLDCSHELRWRLVEGSLGMVDKVLEDVHPPRLLEAAKFARDHLPELFLESKLIVNSRDPRSEGAVAAV
jgi:hypothetical protein